MAWIWVQGKIFCFLIGLAFILPLPVYLIVGLLAIIFTLAMVFVNWLLTIQLVVIVVALIIGCVIATIKDLIIYSIFSGDLFQFSIIVLNIVLKSRWTWIFLLYLVICGLPLIIIKSLQVYYQ